MQYYNNLSVGEVFLFINLLNYNDEFTCEGIIPPMITPLLENKELDLLGLNKWLIIC